MTKKIFAHMLTAIILFLSVSIPCNAAPEFTSALECQSAILMEASTGMVLYEKNAG